LGRRGGGRLGSSVHWRVPGVGGKATETTGTNGAGPPPPPGSGGPELEGGCGRRGEEGAAESGGGRRGKGGVADAGEITSTSRLNGSKHECGKLAQAASPACRFRASSIQGRRNSQRSGRTSLLARSHRPRPSGDSPHTRPRPGGRGALRQQTRRLAPPHAACLVTPARQSRLAHFVRGPPPGWLSQQKPAVDRSQSSSAQRCLPGMYRRGPRPRVLGSDTWSFGGVSRAPRADRALKFIAASRRRHF